MRLIDADALLEELKERRYDQESPSLILTPAGQEIYNSGIDAAWCAVTGSETVDAVPVVRCVDCKYRCTLVCPMYHVETCLDDLDGFDDCDVDRTDDDGFCHLGERWEGEENAAD